ncbi:(2Fe-2S)-binding protein [bacterium]|nr:(2Fe-2S)-binding protein [candidate division CSSED10-310 bacterium]
MKISTTINGQTVHTEIHPGDRLLDVLRRLDLTSVKEGCGDGNCGTCVVLLDGRPVNSCLVPAARIHGHDILTVEGIGSPDAPHPIQEAYADHGAIQCGFCTPGSVLSTFALLRDNPHPSDEEIKRALDGNACRCTGYVKKLAAVRSLVHPAGGDEEHAESHTHHHR